jgi:O-antigen ligase
MTGPSQNHLKNTKAASLIDYIFWAALFVYLLVLPIANTIALRYLGFIVLIGVSIAVLVEERRQPKLPFARCWLFYFLVGLFSVVFAVDPAASFGELRVEIAYCAVIFMVGVTWGNRASAFEPFAILLASINGILTLSAYYYAGISMSFNELLRIPSFAYAGTDGNWLLVAIFLNFWLARRVWNRGHRALPLMLAGLMVLDVWAMMVTQNRQNLVALGAGIAVAAVLMLRMQFSWRRALIFLGLLSVVAALVSVQMLRRGAIGIPQAKFGSPAAISVEQAKSVIGAATTVDDRWGLWKFSLQKIGEHPWIGGGMGRDVFDKLYPEYMPENSQLWHAHNMILNKGIQMGIPGMVAFVALWAALAMEMFRHAGSTGPSRYLAVAGFAGLTAIFTKNMTDDFFVRNSALFFWLIAGLLTGFLQAEAVREPSREG